MDTRSHPSQRLAEEIVARLLRERLLTAQQVNKIQSRLADGNMRPEDWRWTLERSAKSQEAQP